MHKLKYEYWKQNFYLVIFLSIQQYNIFIATVNTFILSNPCNGDTTELGVTEPKEKRATWAPQ